MQASGQATDQVIRVVADGTELVVKLGIQLAGKTAAEAAKLMSRLIALLTAAVQAALADRNSRGAQRLMTMLRSGKNVTVFSVPEGNLKRFAEAAKQYGVAFCALKDKSVSDGAVDLMVYADDAPRINRLIERYGLATVAEVESEQQPVKQEQAQEVQEGVFTMDAAPTADKDERDNDAPVVGNPTDGRRSANEEAIRTSTSKGSPSMSGEESSWSDDRMPVSPMAGKAADQRKPLSEQLAEARKEIHERTVEVEISIPTRKGDDMEL
jgi:hypothetical protein